MFWSPLHRSLGLGSDFAQRLEDSAGHLDHSIVGDPFPGRRWVPYDCLREHALLDVPAHYAAPHPCEAPSCALYASLPREKIHAGFPRLFWLACSRHC